MSMGDTIRKSVRAVLAYLPISMHQPPSYHRWRRFLQEAQFWSPEKVREWQLTRFREVVRLAMDHVEGYRELYRKAGVVPEDIRTVADIKQLPLTTKELFRDNLEAFTVRAHRGRYVTTGGSTAIPFGFYETPETTVLERAFMHEGWTRTGWRLGDVSGVLRGGFVGSGENICRYDRFTRELALSSYQLTASALPRYIEAIRQNNIEVLQVYPSSLNLFCDLLKEQGLSGQLKLRLILLGSENVYTWQLEKFEETFPGARLFSWYGHAEKAVLAPWCEKSQRFHSWPFYGFTELLGPNGEEVETGVEGEIVGTSFHQRLTPFIRYRTLDRAVRGTFGCPDCGRHFQTFSKLSGRTHEVIVTGTGRFISMTAINMHDDIFDPLRQFQFRQEKNGEVIFRYVPRQGPLSESQTGKIRSGLTAKLGADVNLILQEVNDIPRTKAGKYRFLEQLLPIQYGDK
jgi:phenylacetate-CoA ligase